MTQVASLVLLQREVKTRPKKDITARASGLKAGLMQQRKPPWSAKMKSREISSG